MSINFAPAGPDTRIQEFFSISAHGELTGVTNASSSGGTAYIDLGDYYYKHHLLVSGGTEVIYFVTDSASPATDLVDTTERHKMLVSTGGTEKTLNYYARVFYFYVAGGSTVSIFVDSYI